MRDDVACVMTWHAMHLALPATVDEIIAEDGPGRARERALGALRGEEERTKTANVGNIGQRRFDAYFAALTCVGSVA